MGRKAKMVIEENMILCVVFDLDGTLLDTLGDISCCHVSAPLRPRSVKQKACEIFFNKCYIVVCVSRKRLDPEQGEKTDPRRLVCTSKPRAM